jgi:UPF0716 protein FxsA
MVKWIFLAIALLPIAEIAVFVAVAAHFGFLQAVAFTILTSALGFLVLQHAGRAQLAQFRSAVGDGGMTVFEAHAGSLLTVLGGLLLILPGFITDVIGLLLLIPALRRWIAGAVGGAVVRRAQQQTGRNNGVVDLDPDEWRQVQDPQLPNRELPDRAKQPPRDEGPR